MSSFSLIFPEYFADYEGEVKSKGYFSDAMLDVSGKRFRLKFYDLARLSQEIESELEGNRYFFESNILVVKYVTRADMEDAVNRFVQSGQLGLLLPE